MKKEDIAIVGMSIFCPAGESVEEFWHGISQGMDFITEVPPNIIDPIFFDGTSRDLDRFYCSRGGFGKPFKVDPLRYGILPIAADGVDPEQLMALVGVDVALQDADVFSRKLPLQQGSIIIGRGNFGGLIALRSLEIIRMGDQVSKLFKIALPELTDDDLERIKKAYQAKHGRYQADMAIGTMPNLVASLVANRFDMHGPAYTVDAACASGIVAINHSIQLLRSGQCDIAVAGGMHTAQHAMFWSVFNMMGALSRRQEIAPFSENADGLLIGQGGGFIVLKTLEKAIAAGDRIYAVIKDTAVCSDGAGSHVMVTSVKGQNRVLDLAWKSAGMDPKIIGYVEAHGTATPVGDRTEIATLTEFFGDNTHPRAYVGSVKSNIGHTMPAAGMIGVIKTALALYHRKIPPTLHCEKPLAAMYESRFMPPQEALDWDGERIPLIAGVNAFGFGGINAHAILTAHEPPKGARPLPKPRPYLGETLMISAKSGEALIEKLKRGDFTNTGGDYRLVLFNPDSERIQKAISIVEKDKPWKSRLDIWFTNKPLLSAGGKIVYLFPGLNLDMVSETDSISDHFDLPYIEDCLAEAERQGKGITSRHGMRIYFTEWFCVQGLEKLGVDADIYAGHSIGEWNAATFAGMTGSNPDELLSIMDPWHEIPNEYPFVVVGGSDCKTAEQWCREIPGLYLANDNCPSQILLTGTKTATATLIERLKEKQIFHTVLPYGAGYHTPLMADKMQSTHEFMKHVEVHEGRRPVWSATTLEKIPANKEGYTELVTGQLTKPVYFRGLIEKLYKEQDARVFIQIGLGNLIGFVEDTLKDRDFGAIPSCLPTREGIDQLRRVLALLFIEGREVDARFLGVKPFYQTEHSLMILPMSAPTVTDLPELREIVRARYGATGPGGASPFTEEPESPAANPLLSMLNSNLRDAVKVQGELMQLFGQRGQSTPVPQPRPAVPAPVPLPEPFEEPLHLTYEDHPYLVDHSIIRQPPGWPYCEDLNPVVPLTMTIELLAEIAIKRAPGRKLIRISKLIAYRWIGIEKPFAGKVKGVWKNPDLLELELAGHAKAEFSFADEWPIQPEEYMGEIDLGEPTMENAKAGELYDRYSFHGPMYQANVETLRICSRGIENLSRKKEGKGSLLDVMGQQLGLFLHLTQVVNTISFPVRLKELTFYQDIFDQEGIFKHTLIVTKLAENAITGDMVYTRDGKAWCIAREFVCQRFFNDLSMWPVMLKPQYARLAREIAPGIYHYTDRHSNSRAAVLGLLEKRYLNYADKQEYEAIGNRNRKNSYLFSRIALKDAVRSYLGRGDDEMAYPVEVFCTHDENGKPLVHAQGRFEDRMKGLHVSLSHKDSDAVAIVSERPVGIDLEKIEEKPDSFLDAAFTKEERDLLQSLKQPEWAIRFWVAKEACAKKRGTGLRGNPREYVVHAVEGDLLIVATASSPADKDHVQTMRIDREYIVGWTV
jgi:3-oxoacyl-(acyl-carrier-protein) synthase/phosphopantetheinyl transferase